MYPLCAFWFSKTGFYFSFVPAGVKEYCTLLTIFTESSNLVNATSAELIFLKLHIFQPTLIGFQCTEQKVEEEQSLVVFYYFTSMSCLMSLTPCSSATAMMWSRAFMRPNIFTTSLICSLLVDTGCMKSIIGICKNNTVITFKYKSETNMNVGLKQKIILQIV